MGKKVITSASKNHGELLTFTKLGRKPTYNLSSNHQTISSSFAFFRSVFMTGVCFSFTNMVFSFYFPVLASRSANDLCVVNRTATVWTCFILFGDTNGGRGRWNNVYIMMSLFVWEMICNVSNVHLSWYFLLLLFNIKLNASALDK